MKKILFAAFAVTILTVGCQKTEVINQVGPTDGSLMSFSTEMSKLTKSTGENDAADADSAGMYNLRAQEFKIWAYCDYDDPNTTDFDELDEPYDGIENLNIDYDQPADYEGTDEDDKGTWKPVKEYYWPSAGKFLRFFAVSGAGTYTVTPNITRNEETETAIPTLTITDYVVNSQSPNTDLMVADFIRQDKETPNTGKRVTFNFRHALSKVQFMFQTTQSSEAPVYIQSLTVKGINTKSTLTVSEGEEKFSWSTPTLPLPFNDDYVGDDDDFNQIFSSIEKLNPTITDDKTVCKLTNQAQEFATWLVLPQAIVTKDANDTIIDGLKVEVIYVIGTRQFKAVFPLYVEGTLEEWAVNQYTKYLVTITPNKITFNAEAEEWAPYNSTTQNPNGDDINLQN